MRSDHALFPALLLVAALAGCAAHPQAAKVPVSAEDPFSFHENLPRAKTVCREDALRALAEVGGLENADSASHADRLKAMTEKGWLSAAAAKEAQAAPLEAATRGQVAAVLCPMLHIKGGLSMRMESPWGASERYATRELVGLGLLPPGSSPDQPLSGMEFVRVLSFASRYQETHP